MTKKNYQLLMLLSAVGLMAFTACTTDKYDLGDLDTTIGVGSDEGLTLPTSSTDTIFIEDILELNNNKNVAIKENGDYVFLQEGSNATPAKPRIEKVLITDGSSENIPVNIEVPTLPGFDQIPTGTPIENTKGSVHKDIQVFNYKGSHPAEIVSLKSADVEGHISIKIMFTNDLAGFIKEFETFDVEFPTYMDLTITTASHTYTLTDNVLKFNNVPTNKPLTIEAEMTKLDFDPSKLDENNSLTFTDSDIIINGHVKVNASYNDIVKDDGDLTNLQINSEMSITNLTIISAIGCFNPEIDLHNLGSSTIGDLPNFLSDEGVVLDFYNPQLIINIENTMPISGLLWGTLAATDENGNIVTDENGKEITLNIYESDGVRIEAEGNSKIVICGRKDATTVSDATYILEKHDELSSIIRNLNRINTLVFTAEARAEDSYNDRHFILSHDYLIEPSYNIEAPIAFGEDARIVYNDVLDGWNDDIQDYDFVDTTYIEVTTEIENCIPAQVTMSAQAIGIDGEPVKNLTVSVEYYSESHNGYVDNKNGGIIRAADRKGKDSKEITPTSTPIRIIIKQEKGSNALKNVDGITYNLEVAAAKGLEGITLNAYAHYLKATNIKVTLKGKVIIKTDD